MIDKGLLKLFFVSVLCLLSVSCIQDLGYDQEDLTPILQGGIPKRIYLGFILRIESIYRLFSF